MALGTPIVLVGLVGLVAAIALLTLGTVWLFRGRRGLGVALLGAGVLVLAAAFAATMALADSDREQTVTVAGLNPETDPPFTVEIEHLIGLGPTPEYYDFWAAGNQEEVLAVFEAQHPDGERTQPNSDQATLIDGSLWHLSTDRMRYELIPGANVDGFTVVTQVATLESADRSAVVRIPYPATDQIADLSEVTTYATDWTADDWRAFYTDIGQAEIDGDTITLPTDTDATVTLTLGTEGVTFAINP